MTQPKKTTDSKRRLTTYVPPMRSTFLPMRKKDFEESARSAGFMSISKRQVDALGEVGRYLVSRVGAENLGIAYVARSHELTDRLTRECDELLAKCESDDQRIELVKLMQVSARQLADNGKLLIASEHLAIQSQATIIQTNRSAPPGAASAPCTPPQSVTVEVEQNTSSKP